MNQKQRNIIIENIIKGNDDFSIFWREFPYAGEQNRTLPYVEALRRLSDHDGSCHVMVTHGDVRIEHANRYPVTLGRVRRLVKKHRAGESI